MKTKNLDNPLSLVVLIVSQNKTQEVKKFFQEYKIFQFVSEYAQGTVIDNSDLFGFGVMDREIYFALAKSALVEKILPKAFEVFEFDKVGNGMAMSLPIESSTINTLKLLCPKFLKENNLL